MSHSIGRFHLVRIRHGCGLDKTPERKGNVTKKRRELGGMWSMGQTAMLDQSASSRFEGIVEEDKSAAKHNTEASYKFYGFLPISKTPAKGFVKYSWKTSGMLL
jgi:hypothetical protein